MGYGRMGYGNETVPDGVNEVIEYCEVFRHTLVRCDCAQVPCDHLCQCIGVTRPRLILSEEHTGSMHCKIHV